MNKLSIIIPTLNEADYLPELLHTLRNQTRLPDEIIVADANSIDGTAGIARASGVIVVSGGKPSVGRNAGAKAATGDIFLFLDADVQPGLEFIERALNEFTRAGGGFGSCFIDTWNPTFVDRIIIELSNVCMWAVKPISPHAPGCCLLVDRTTYRLTGGFDETLLLSEDHDFVRRASKYAKFHILTSVRIPISLRRIEKEGLGILLLKYLWCGLHDLTKTPVRSLPFAYEFGGYCPAQAKHSMFYAVRRWAKRIWFIRN